MARKKSNLLNDELVNFKGFQDSQLSALNSIAKSMESNLEISHRLEDSLTSIVSQMDNIGKSSKNLELEKYRFMEQMQRREKEIHDMYSNHRIKSIQKEEKAIADALKQLKDLGEDASEIDLERIKNQIDNAIKSEDEKMKKSDEFLKKLGHQLDKFAWHVAKTANRFSELSNSLIQVSGASGADVRDTRNNIVRETVRQLNRETGNFFSYEKSYENMIAIAKEANIGSLEVIEELSRPMLLASEALEVNNAELASLFSKWYTRYNFSSSAMEEMVDEIRGNTAGNNATAEATLENINAFQHIISKYANTEEAILGITSAISSETSRLESAGMNSGYAFNFLKEAASGDHSNMETILSILNYSDSAFEGNYRGFVDALISGDEGLVSQAISAFVDGLTNMDVNFSPYTYGEQAKVFGVDYDQLMDYSGGANALLSSDEFKASVSGSQSAVEAINDKFNTWADKIANDVQRIAEWVATGQERTGLGFSDILSAAAITMSIVSMVKGAGGVSNLLGGAKGALSGIFRSSTSPGVTGGTSLASNILPKLGGIGIGLAGAAGATYGISSGIEDIQQGKTGIGISNIAGGAAMGAGGGIVAASMLGLGAANAWNPAGWALLAGGAATLAITKLIEKSKELTGSAEAVSNNIKAAGESLEKENTNRLSKIYELDYNFSQESDIVKKRQLLEESGLFSQEKLNNTTDEQLQALLDSYKSASEAMDDITQNIIKTTDKYYTEIFDKQHKDFVTDLEGVTNKEDRLAAAKLLNLYAGDIGIDEYLSDDKISGGEWRKIVKGAKKSDLSVEAMKILDSRLGFGNTYLDESAVSEANAFIGSLTKSGSQEAFDKIIESNKEKGFYSAYMREFGDSISELRNTFAVPEYATGSNYIRSNRLALIHEGEAIVPKKYNPQANMNELEMLRRYYNESNSSSDSDLASNMREFKEILAEIRSFLAYWREDNIQRDMARGNSAMDYNLYNVARYNLY